MLTFPILRIPVTIRPSFLLIAVLIGLGVGDPVFVVAWALVVFVSIVIHELGHALTARGFGAEVTIELNGVGGLTRWEVERGELGPGRRAIVAAAGSGVGVLFGGLVWLLASQFGPYPRLAAFVLDNLIFVNLFWGLLNWAPIRPLDGGHLLMSLLEKVAPDRGDRIGRAVFIVTSGAALGVALYFRQPLIAILAGWLFLAELSTGRPPPPRELPELTYDDAAAEPERPDH